MRGLADRRRQRQLYRLIVEHDLDIIALQETKVEGEDQTGRMVRSFTTRYDACVSQAVGMSAGCVLLVRQSLGAVVQAVTTCVSGRLVVCDFSFSAVEWRVICVYAPTRVGERMAFFESLQYYCNCPRLVMLLGDFNCVCAASDKTSSTPYIDASTECLKELVNEFGLEDVGDCLRNGPLVNFTHFQGLSHARLDRVYVPLDLVPLCHDYHVCPVSFSDHCLVKVSLRSKNEGRKVFCWELWKLNAKLLQDEIFKRRVQEAVECMTDTDKSAGHGVKWEIFKQNIKMMAIERASVIKNEEKKMEKGMRLTLEMLVKEECRTPGAFKDDILTLKEKLEQIDRDRYRGALVRARADRLIAGEAPTKRALGMGKKYARRNDIAEIEQNGSITSDSVEIERAFFDYYSALFSYTPVNVDRFKSDFLAFMPKLGDETKSVLEGPITYEEVKTAIEALNPGKSPGPDGLTAAFYKALNHTLSPVLVDVFNEAFEVNILPPSFLTAHTILIPKTEEVTKLRQVKSYRPISLTNVDYKILMKILAGRVQSVISELVGPHQTCGIRGRTIFTNTHTARSILECCDAMHSRVAMLQLDLEKAFDRVPHDALLAVLDHVNVGSVIREGVRMAYDGCTTSLIINKSVGKRIQVQRLYAKAALYPRYFSVFI